MTDKEAPLVLDFGSSLAKLGYAGEDVPRLSIPTCFYRQEGQKTDSKTTPLSTTTPNNSDASSPSSIIYFGNDAMQENFSTQQYQSLSWPVQHGMITDWDMAEQFFTYMFEHNKIMCNNTEQQPLLFAEATENAPENRQKLAEIFFEKFKMPKLYFAKQAALDMYSTGRTSGLVLDIGHTLTQVVPVFEGFCLSHAVLRSNLGGHDLSLYMQELIQERFKERSAIPAAKKKKESKLLLKKNLARVDPNDKTLQNIQIKEATSLPFETIAGYFTVQKVKEKLCSIASNFEKDVQSTQVQKEYVLPDKSIITVSAKEVYKCPESLFDPKLIGKSIPGVHQSVAHSFSKCDEYCKRIMSQNVVLAGGGSMFAGMRQRLSRELAILSALDSKLTLLSGVKIDDASERKLACWIGGSMLASLDTFKDLLVRKQDYDESGANVVFKNCI